ncbi:MAG TPA: hypothetical protein VGL09_17630 [Methylomirabilota bacterium]
MPRLFLEFWRLRQHAVVEEVVRGGSRRPRTTAPWSLSSDVKERLRPLLESHGFDVAQDIVARESAGQNGFDLSQ